MVFNIEILYCLLIFVSSPINLFPIYSIAYENKRISALIKKHSVGRSVTAGSQAVPDKADGPRGHFGGLLLGGRHRPQLHRLYQRGRLALVLPFGLCDSCRLH